MSRTILCFTAWLVLVGAALAADTASVRIADSFALPVGHDSGKKYYKARGMRPNGHLGEDWNGVGGGNTDLGDPVYCTANGLVVYARDFRSGWGNVVIVRHAYLEGNTMRYVDSLYGHLNRISVKEGQRVDRLDRVGTIGTAHGQYPAHLHFEMRKDIRIGMYRSMFARDYRAYFDPTQFIVSHQKPNGGSRTVSVPINTFPNQSGFKTATKYADTKPTKGSDKPSPTTTGGKRIIFSSQPRWSADTSKVTRNSPVAPKKKGTFQVDRFEDIRKKK
ncbi:MAG: M23 family metallopeptidase [Chthoniobacteraceae bacterium]